MNDKRLILIKHGRIMLPFAVLILILSIAHISSSKEVVNEVYGIGSMFLSFTLAVYALTSIISLIGLCDDRLLLLSPMSRWKLVLKDTSILAFYLLIAHIVRTIPKFSYKTFDLNFYLLEMIGYLISLFSGLGLMVMFVYVLKGINSRSVYLAVAWVMYIAVTFLLLYIVVQLINKHIGNYMWFIGATPSEHTTNLYGGICPVTLIDMHLESSKLIIFDLYNLAVGVVAWVVSKIISIHRINYLQVR